MNQQATRPAQTQNQGPKATQQTGLTSKAAADEAMKNLDLILSATPSAVSSVITRAFEGEYIARLRDVLPDALKPQAERFVKRAAIYFIKHQDILSECTVVSKIQCVIEAGEMGLAVDGKLCYAIPYNCKYKDERNVERWHKIANCQPSYLGLTVVAKRTGEITDAYGDVVCEGDHFDHGRKGGQNILEHSFDIGQQRGKVIGAYCIIILPDGRWRTEVMQIDDLERIRKRSKKPDSGPWATDTNEMYKKTVLRRGLKMYCSDPGTMRALEIDENEYSDASLNVTIEPADHKKVRRSPLNDRKTIAGPEDNPADDRQPDKQEYEQYEKEREQRGTGGSEPGRGGDHPDKTTEPSQAADPVTAADPADHKFPERPEDQGRQPGDDTVEPEHSDNDVQLSDLALAFEDQLNEPKLTRERNASIMQDVMAADALTDAERKHLDTLIVRNRKNFRGK
jgi:recombination protein RecT